MLLEQKLKEEEEKLFYEKQYKNQQDQFEENARVLQELRVRYKGALEEIKDLEEEHQNEHAELINTVREQQHELLLVKGMLQMLLKDNEIEKIRHRSSFDDENQKWDIPFFYLQAKNVAFPKLNRNQAKDLVENEKENRELQFGQKSSADESSRNSSNTYNSSKGLKRGSINALSQPNLHSMKQLEEKKFESNQGYQNYNKPTPELSIRPFEPPSLNAEYEFSSHNLK